MIRLWKIVVYLLLGIMFQACLNEDELDFPSEATDTLTVIPSVAIQSLLRAVEQGSLSGNNACIELFFPLNLGFSNELTISVNSLAGLEEVAKSGSSGQHVSGVVFPFIVSKANSIRNIENEEDLITLLEDCDHLTLRDEFDFYYTQCFDFEYPIQMVDNQNNKLTIASQNEYFDFERQLGFDAQPEFVFPLKVKKFSTDQTLEIASPYDLFEVFDSCERCSQLFFSTDFIGGTSYLFEADFPNRDDLFSYDWFIDNEFIEKDGTGVQGDHKLIRTFDPGEYTVCIKATTDDCVVGVSYCQTIIVEDPCPELSFETSKINDVLYTFTANFQLKDEITYFWKIFEADNLIFSETEGVGGDNLLEFQFDAGNFEVCITAEVQGCPNEVIICENILVP